MRALTVRQPWAQAIVGGAKPVENRSRPVSYRGPLLIHAGAAWDRTAFDHEPLARYLAAQWAVTRDNWVGTSLPTGVVLGTVDLVDVHAHDERRGCHRRVDIVGWAPWDGSDASQAGWEPRTCSAWALAGHHHWVLANARPLPERIPTKGRLGLWAPEADLLRQVAEQTVPA